MMQKSLFVALTAALLLTPALAQSSSATSGSTTAGSKPSASTATQNSTSGTSSTRTGAATRMGMARVNVNSATLAQLEKIPGMSTKLAQEVVKSRPYKSESDFVKKVKGIGKKNVKKFEGYLSF